MLSTRNLFEGKALRYAGAVASGLAGPFYWWNSWGISS
jgi:hypothetical protein